MPGGHTGNIKWGIHRTTEARGAQVYLVQIQIWKRLMDQMDAVQATEPGCLMCRIQCVAEMIPLALFELQSVHSPVIYTTLRTSAWDFFPLLGPERLLLNHMSQATQPRVNALNQLKNYIRTRKRLRPFILGSLTLFIIAEIVALSPSSVEHSKLQTPTIDPEAFIPDESVPTLATGIPKGRIPEYDVDQFDYVSVDNGIKQWKLRASRAYMFNREKLVHSRAVHALIYDGENKTTDVTGREAKYFMNRRDLEIFGNVITVLPDGFRIESEYLRYQPGEGRITIPSKYEVRGIGTENDGQKISFISYGMTYDMKDAKVFLDRQVRVNFEKSAEADPSSTGVPERTLIESDRCLIYRNQQLAVFTMEPSRSPDARFVHITQPNLFVRSRKADLNYGSFNQVIQYLVAKEDVLVKEKARPPQTKPSANPKLRYATAGQAAFDTKRDVVVLTDYPQVYEDQDTVTGDVILLHRDTDLVEIENSNAFSEGSNE